MERNVVDKKDLLGLMPDELSALMKEAGEKPFRAKQVLKWLYQGVTEFSGMTDLPQALRTRLSGLFTIGGVTLRGVLVSQIDETRKYLFDLADGHVVEGVLMKYEHGMSACISTQVGCRMGCTFCASAPLGLVRSLTAGEMLAQILLMGRDADVRVSHVVLMGIGEPFDNYDAVMRFLRCANHEEMLGISSRRLTVSTCGIVPQILRFADEGMSVNLSVSLHAPNDAVRMETMPVARSWPMEELLAACWTYVEKTGRRVTFEYSLIAGVNDSQVAATELADRLAGRLCHVNLIPVNTVPGTGYDKSNRRTILQFQEILTRRGIAATVRRELGSDIMAACGQLRRDTMEGDGKGMDHVHSQK